MVWCLSPLDPLPGEHQYYIFTQGTYKVGRKGCDIIVTKDKGVSRIHAELVIDEMICVDSSQKSYSPSSSKVRIRDCSKYGTFVTRNMGSKEKIHELPNKETTLNDGDVVSFGTGNANYRFRFLPLVFFPYSLKPSVVRQLREKAQLVGASLSLKWTNQCTHMIVDDSTSVSDETINAIISKRDLVKVTWIEEIVGKTICTEIPSALSHAPTFSLQSVSVEVTDPQHREQCLKEYSFLLESVHKYKFKEKLPLLLDVCGAKVIYVKDMEPYSKKPGDRLICVMPANSTSYTECFGKFSHFPKLKEMDLISAVLSGHLDPSSVESDPVIVSSSCSTDETVVADSDLETETATSIEISVANNKKASAEDKDDNMIGIEEKSNLSADNCKAGKTINITDSVEHNSGSANINIEEESLEVLPPNQDNLNANASYTATVKSDTVHNSLLKKEEHFTTGRDDKFQVSGFENVDVIYSQDLIVRDSYLPRKSCSSMGSDATINFKRFRKSNVPSGNSFHNLVPFSKHPYEETDYGNEDVAESVKEEKRRKQMEAIADDLFNSEKARKRGAGGTLRGLFGRG